MAFVYWIHLPHHVDIATEGYVGITTMDNPQSRFSKHKSDARNPKNSFIVHKAINKYGDEIVFDVVCECSAEDAYSLELKLRPEKHIGWNINKGGEKPLLGGTWTDEQRCKFKLTKKNSPPPVRQEISTQRQKETIDSKHPLDLHRLNLLFWSHCFVLYDLYVQGDSAFVATRRLGLTRCGVHAMWKRFNRGWIPTEDPRMQEFIKDNPPTLEPDMSVIDTKTNIVGVTLHKGSYVGYKNINGKRVSKYFSIKKHGEEVAFQLAKDFRDALDDET